MNQSRFIALVGGSGSGKTWLAANMQTWLGADAGHLSLDDFYRDLGHLPEAARDAVNFDDPAAIDWDALREVLECLERGEAARIPIYDFVTHTRHVATRHLAPARFVVVDGLWLLHHAWLREKFTLRVFIDCSAAERLQRRIERDVMQRGRAEDSVRRQFARHVQPMHERFVEPQRHWATHCVSSPLPKHQHAALLAACLKK
jgi:uridine kinase